MDVVGIAQSCHGLQAAEEAQLVLRKDVVGTRVLAGNTVALAGKGFAHELGSSREFVGIRQTEDATQRAIGIARLFARLGVCLGLGRLPVIVVGAEIVGMDVKVEMRRLIGRPTKASAPGVGLVMEIVGVGRAGGVGIDLLAGGGVFRRLLREVGGTLGAVCLVVVGIAADVGRPRVVEAPLQPFAEGVAAKGYGHGTARELQHLLVALAEGLIGVDRPVVGLPTGVGGVAGERARGDVGVDVVVETAVVHGLRADGSSHRVATTVGDDVDDARYGIATVEGAGCSAEHLDATHVAEADLCPAVVAAHTTSVLKDDDVVVAHSTKVDKRAHAAGVGGDGGGEARQGVLQRGHPCIAQLLGRDGLDSHGSVGSLMVGACAGDDNGVQRHGSQGISRTLRHDGRRNDEESTP